jgi:hypothetical protein
MSDHTRRANVPTWMVIAALICCAGIWLFATRLLIPYQVADASAHDRPRGNLSDLYPRWLGARELLLHRRDPYSAEVAREIQAGYYGHPLDASRPGDPRDQQGFAYPVYVVFCLAPTVRLPFEIVQRVFFWMLAVLTAASALIWLAIFRWRAAFRTQFTVVVLTLGSLAVMQGLKLEQISLLVSGLVTIAVLLLVKDHAVPAGIVLALATIKPQLVVFLLLWLAMWTLADLRRRYVWCVSFLVTMTILFAASEWYLPHWIPRFVQALREYQTYTGAMGVMEKLIGTSAGRTLEVLVLAMMLMTCWRQRQVPASTPAFAFTVGLVLAITVLLAPTYAVYNQVLLIPALLALVGQRATICRKNLATRLLVAVTALLVFWPWIASVALACLSFVLPPATVERGWAVPFWTALLIPVGVAAVMLVCARQRTFAASAEAGTS